MRLGFNFTRGDLLWITRRLLDERRIGFCELLIDNFLKVPPADLAANLECPVGFHIMFSKFLESDDDFLRDLAKRLRVYIGALQPVYVSDHIARFSHRNRQLYYLAEVDYPKEYEAIRRRVEWWQEALGQRLYLENYPSIMDGGWDAPAFYERLVKETGAGVLFDVSNAVCAQRNCGAPAQAWEGVIAATHHFHVAGYNKSFIEPYVTLDTHDREMGQDTLAYLARYRQQLDKDGATMTYERDLNQDYDSIASDLGKLADLFGASREAA